MRRLSRKVRRVQFSVMFVLAQRSEQPAHFPVDVLRYRASALAVGGNDRAYPLLRRQSLADEFRGTPLHRRRQLDTLDGADLGEPLAAERDALAGVRGAPVTVGR